MKSLKDIEKMSFEELEKVSEDTNAGVPEGLSERLEAAVTGLAASSGTSVRHAGRVRTFALPAAGVALAAAAAVLAVGRYSSPKDTFDDPVLAYAQVEKSFSMISEKMNKGIDLAAEAVPVMNKPREIIDKINEK